MFRQQLSVMTRCIKLTTGRYCNFSVGGVAYDVGFTARRVRLAKSLGAKLPESMDIHGMRNCF